MYHQAVMVKESLEGLNINPEGIYVDATFGGGGHARALLKYLNEQGRLLAFDQDEDAVQNAIDDSRFTLIQQNFRYLKNFLRFHQVDKADGILADLGVSSHQFDTSHRGFSFRTEGPLDMRMNMKASLNASQVVNTYELDHLTQILRDFGDLKNAYQLALFLVNQREKNPIKTTNQLINLAEKFAPRHQEFKYYAKLLQAIRIEVNDEINALKEFLVQSKDSLKKGGRLVVISYHSLEDRMVKNFIKSDNFEGKIEKDFYGNPQVSFKAISRKPVIPEEDELNTNNRSRSAKLRIAEKL